MGRQRQRPFSPVMERVLRACGIGADVPTAQKLSRLAIYLDVPEGTVRNWDKREVPTERLVEIAAKTHTSVQALLGNGHVDPKAPTAYAREPITTALRTSEGPDLAFYIDDPSLQTAVQFKVVPRLAARPSAGYGKGETSDELIGEFAFEINWMKHNLGRIGDGFVSVQVQGDSMQPTLLHGDEIVIDKNVIRVDVSGIYVISLRGDLLVKRVHRKLDGSLLVKSDNPAYEPEEISAERAEEFRVLGRLVWPRVR